MARCANCGNKDDKWIYKKETRRYCGDSYLFGLEVEQPYCPKCGEPVYVREVEAKIRAKAHDIINKCKKGENK